MIVARCAMCLGNTLEILRTFEDRTGFHLADKRALDLLPRCLRCGIGIARLREVLAPLCQFGFVKQQVGSAGAQINAHAVAGADESEATARSRFGTGV